MSINKISFKDRDSWLSYRKDGIKIGSSDIGYILGLSNFKTPLEHWKEMTSNTSILNDSMKRGIIWEDAISHMFEEYTGNKIIKRSNEYASYSNSKYPSYFECSPDREIFKYDKECRPLAEIKDTKLTISLQNKDGFPYEWYCQLQYQLGILEREYGFLIVYDGTKGLKYRLFEFDKECFETIINKCSVWYENHIIKNIAPDPINGKDIINLYPDSSSNTKKVSAEVKEIKDNLVSIKDEIKQLEKRQILLEDKLKLNFKDADTLEFEGVPIATFKTFTLNKFDIETFRKENPELYNKYLIPIKNRRLMLKNK